MANYKKQFPKKPQSLTSITAKMLGKNSNRAGYQASLKAIYHQKPQIQDTLTDTQRKELKALQKTLPKHILIKKPAEV